MHNQRKIPWILIVDDDDAFRKALSDFLNQSGYRPVGAAKVNEALAKLSNQKFDCVLLDMRFEYRDGEQVIDVIRTDPRAFNFATPVIVMSGYLDSATVRRVGRHVDGVLVKPFDHPALLARIESAMRARAQGRPEGGEPGACAQK